MFQQRVLEMIRCRSLFHMLVCPSYIHLFSACRVEASANLYHRTRQNKIWDFLFLKPWTARRLASMDNQTKSHAPFGGRSRRLQKARPCRAMHISRRRRALENDLSPGIRLTVAPPHAQATPGLCPSKLNLYLDLLAHLLASCRRMEASLLAA